MKGLENFLSAMIIVSNNNHQWILKSPSTEESCLAQGYLVSGDSPHPKARSMCMGLDPDGAESGR